MAIKEDYKGYEYLLNQAHERGIHSIDTELKQVPDASNENRAIVRAVVVMEDGAKFSGIGDASPRDTKNPPIRMAETRAKRRALVDATNSGELAAEEAGEAEDNVARMPNQRPRGVPVQEVGMEQDNAPSEAPDASVQGPKARKSQVDLLKTLAVEWRGENGVERLENRLGCAVEDLTRAAADEWIDRLTPGERDENQEAMDVAEGETRHDPSTAEPNDTQVKRYQWLHKEMGYPVPDAEIVRSNYTDEEIGHEIESLTKQWQESKQRSSG